MRLFDRNGNEITDDVFRAAETTEALRACVEHMEWSTPEGKQAYDNAMSILARLNRHGNGRK